MQYLEMAQRFSISVYVALLNPVTIIALLSLCIVCIALVRTGQVHRGALKVLTGLGALLLLATWLAVGQHILLNTVLFLNPWDATPTPPVAMWQLRLHHLLSQAPFAVSLIPPFAIVGASAWLFVKKARRASSRARRVEQLFVFSASNLIFTGSAYLLSFLLFSNAALWRMQKRQLPTSSCCCRFRCCSLCWRHCFGRSNTWEVSLTARTSKAIFWRFNV